MAGEAGRAVRHFLEALYLGFGEAAGEAGLLDLARLPGDELGQGGGGEVQLGSDPWSQAVVTKLTVAPQIYDLLDDKLPVCHGVNPVIDLWLPTPSDPQ